MSDKRIILGVLVLLGIIFLNNVSVDKITIENPTQTEQEVTAQKTTRPLQETRTAENPISSEAIPVPEEVSSIQKRSFIDNLLNRKVAFTPIPDPGILPKDIRNAILSVLSVLDVTETLSPNQVRFGGPAVIKRLREGAVALLVPKTLGVYFNKESGASGIGGNLFSQEAWTGPYTETSCGVGFYEVVEVGGTEFCDVIRYDFYTDNPEDPDELNKSIAIALSVTDEQYCDAECTQPSCKAVCEAIGADPATAYLWNETGDGADICGCGQPIYTSSCVDTNGDSFGDACVQVPGGDGQSTCATDGDCTQTFRGCLGGACVELRGSAGIAGIAQCDTDLECLLDEEKFTHSTCLGSQCVQVPGAGFDECGADAPWALPCEKQCILETVTITDPDGTTRQEEICERPAVQYSCLTTDNLRYVADPELQDLLWSEVEPWGEAVGPQCALVRCIDEDNSGFITPDECGGGDSCLDSDGIPDDGECGYESKGPSGPDAISSTEPLVDFPWVIDGSEFDPPPLPELGSGSGGTTPGFVSVATCADLGGGGFDPATGEQIPDGVWDACIIGGESNIACETPSDCDRLVRSQCAGEQCVSVSGPGINSCGDPQDPSWDPATEAETACALGTCSSLATTLLNYPGITLGEGGNCRGDVCSSAPAVCDLMTPEQNLRNVANSSECLATTFAVDPDIAGCALSNTTTVPLGESLLQGLVDYADRCSAMGRSYNIIWLTGGDHVSNSRHYQGRAADFTGWCGSYSGEAQWWAGKGYDVCTYSSQGHLHVSTGSGGASTGTGNIKNCD